MNLYNIPTHKNSPEIVTAVIEISKGTNVKYEYDPDLGHFRLDRCLASAMVYTASYGFIPSTLADDGDPLDILVYNNTPIDRGTLVECRVIGALDMTDDGKKDYKILATPTSHAKNYTCIHRDIDSTFLEVTTNFFQHYKDLDQKHVEVGEWLHAEEAREIVLRDTIPLDSL
tara:strand:+ start:1019 stop:1534 length:516 start_codon:yes stop_codon:yes gene_type:complete